MKSYVFLDTNIILDTDLFHLLEEEENNTFIITSQVLEELNGLKQDVKNHRGYLQRKQLQSLYMLSEKFNNLMFIPDNKTNLSKRFNEKINDNIILNTVIEFKKNHQDDNVMLFTNDIQLILKQKLYNVPIRTNIKRIDLHNILREPPIIKIKNFEEIQEFVENNRFNELEHHLPIDKLNLQDDNIEISKYFYVTDMEETEKYLMKRVDNENFTFVQLESLIHRHYLKENIYNSYNMNIIKPKSNSQLMFLDSLFGDEKIVMSLSKSGTGKTLLQLFYQLTEILRYKHLGKGNYSKIVFIVNPSFISQKEIGFLPGSKHEKILPFMEGIMDNLNFLFNNSVPDDFNILKTDLNEYFEIRPISFIRGQSLNNSIVIVDEVQNLNIHEIRSIVTRVSDTSKLILLGDINQVDERIQIDYLGIVKFVDILMNNIDKLNWRVQNVHIKESQRNELINILNEFFEIF